VFSCAGGERPDLAPVSGFGGPACPRLAASAPESNSPRVTGGPSVPGTPLPPSGPCVPPRAPPDICTGGASFVGLPGVGAGRGLSGPAGGCSPEPAPGGGRFSPVGGGAVRDTPKAVVWCAVPASCAPVGSAARPSAGVAAPPPCAGCASVWSDGPGGAPAGPASRCAADGPGLGGVPATQTSPGWRPPCGGYVSWPCCGPAACEP
jgi:hypothetical protein